MEFTRVLFRSRRARSVSNRSWRAPCAARRIEPRTQTAQVPRYTALARGTRDERVKQGARDDSCGAWILATAVVVLGHGSSVGVGARVPYQIVHGERRAQPGVSSYARRPRKSLDTPPWSAALVTTG